MTDTVIVIGIIVVVGILILLLYEGDKSNINSRESNEDTKGFENTPATKEVVNDQEQNYVKTNNSDESYLKIYKSRVPNTNISLEKKVPVSEFINYVRVEDQKSLLSEMGYVHMWDFGVNASKYLNEGDKIWILTGNKLYETELKFIIKDEEGKIGDTIGWARQFGGPWKNVAIFKSCDKHDSIPSWIQPYSKKQKRSIAKNFYKLD